MPISIVAGNALPEPDNLLHAQVIAYIALDVGALQVRVTIRIEQALLRGQTTPTAVHIDGAAFQHNPGHEARHLKERGNLLRQGVVWQEIDILATPGVELPIVQG
jgi:hypothetical protein